jgi:hypothetical protein
MPGNWELETASDLLFAASGGMIDGGVTYPLDRPMARAETSSSSQLPVTPEVTTTKTKSVEDYETDDYEDILKPQALSIETFKIEYKKLAA